MTSIMLRGGHVYTPVDPFATAMLIIDGTIRWIGSDTGADVHRDAASTVIDLAGALVTPAFVDAHIHATATGLLGTGLDLSHCHSSDDLLALLRTDAPAHGVVWGHGWDESAWADGRLPSRAQIDEVLPGRVVYLARTDVHSAMVSSALLNLLPAASADPVHTWPGFHPQGPISQHTHAIARSVAFDRLGTTQRVAAQQWTLGRATSRGIASVHEMAGPKISSAEDLKSLTALVAEDAFAPELVSYWGALLEVDQARALGAQGCAGDLFIDGSIGSHTAAIRTAYADAPGDSGAAYLSIEEVGQHVRACTLAGLQAGFHVIGDHAIDIAMAGFAIAAEDVGDERLRQVRHRLEHVEMLHPEHIDQMARWGIVASMQPAFDARWGGESGMYASRLGRPRSDTLNPFAQLSQTGVCLAWGSDAPVTPLDPWASVRAAAFPHVAEHAISVRASFAAHTRGGRRAAGQELHQPGVLREDAPATLAIWAPSDLVVQAPDSRISAWSTDARSGTPGLPDVAPGAALPQCWLTMRDGEVIFDTQALELSP